MTAEHSLLRGIISGKDPDVWTRLVCLRTGRRLIRRGVMGTGVGGISKAVCCLGLQLKLRKGRSILGLSIATWAASKHGTELEEKHLKRENQAKTPLIN